VKLAFHALAGLGAFLLFVLEPLIAKALLPRFGGGAGVWTTCMLFFQAALLAGYAYAHAIGARLRPLAQAGLHLAILVFSLAFLPIGASERGDLSAAIAPELALLWVLSTSIGLPFLLLSATSPLLQLWAARLRPSSSPFLLYASSNLGSLLALVTYPVVIEPSLVLTAQARAWSVAYGAFALLLGALGLYVGRATAPEIEAPARGSGHVGGERRFLWLALPACSSIVLLGVTNELSQDVAPVPFLWVVPLATYLVSFILCFASDRAYSRTWLLRGLVLALAAISWTVALPGRLSLFVALPLHVGALFVACMVAHGELARLRPSPRSLTAFYLASSAGSAVGAAFVSVLAPRLFTGTWELLLGVAALLPLALVAAAHDPGSPFAGRHAEARRTALVLGGGVLVAILVALDGATADVHRAARNFYGVLRVVDTEHDGHPLRSLIHGVTNHGSQFLEPRLRGKPTAYYGRTSGVGLALTHHRSSGPRRVGVVGLGAGNVATYGKAGDRFRFYEINPLVIEFAEREFHFLNDSAATIEVVLGDARLVLEDEPSQGFDLLIVDAFSSGSIPIHCLTREAFEVYLRHLGPGGLLAIHVSNDHLDLEPVVAAAARATGQKAVVVESRENREEALLHATWILVGASAAFAEDSPIRGASRPVGGAEVVWTDDDSSLFSVLR
jgi:hypothetical protein